MANNDLSGHTVAELKDIAEDEGIELPSHANKDEIIEAIEQHRAGGGEAARPEAESGGSFHKNDEPDDWPDYELTIMEGEGDPHGHTHHAHNEQRHWSGTKEQFEAQFGGE